MPLKRGDDLSYTLLTNGSASGSAVAIKGGEYMFFAEGTAGGSTTSLQMQNPNGTWANIAIFAGSIVSSSSLPFSQAQIALPAGNVRVALSGGSPSGVSAWLVGVG